MLWVVNLGKLYLSCIKIQNVGMQDYFTYDFFRELKFKSYEYQILSEAKRAEKVPKMNCQIHGNLIN